MEKIELRILWQDEDEVYYWQASLPGNQEALIVGNMCYPSEEMAYSKASSFLIALVPDREIILVETIKKED